MLKVIKLYGWMKRSLSNPLIFPFFILLGRLL